MKKNRTAEAKKPQRSPLKDKLLHAHKRGVKDATKLTLGVLGYIKDPGNTEPWQHYRDHAN